MNGSTILIMFQVALLILMKTPLCNCLSLRSCKIFFGFGASLRILNKVRKLANATNHAKGTRTNFREHNNTNGYLPSNSNDKGNLWLGLNEEVSFLLGGSSVLNELLVGGSVLVEVSLSVGGSGLSGDNSISLSLDSSVLNGGGKFLVSCLLLKNVFWDNSGSTITINKTMKGEKPTLLPFYMLNIINNN